MSNLRIITTEDGSHSLLNEAMDETYHSRHGALQESEYVFIEKGFSFFLERSHTDKLSILEIGFGTGLNAWLTARKAETEKKQVAYTSLETFPIPEEIWSELNYAAEDKLLFEKIHRAAWNEWAGVSPLFTLRKSTTSLQQATLDADAYDIIYFDAFAPNKQPEMWELAVIKKTVDALKPGGVFVTYCAKGQLKRDLKTLGLDVESLPGPPGKREMVRALRKVS